MHKFYAQLLATSAIILGLTACADNSVDRKANAAIPASTVALMASKGVTPADPVMMRIVKADSKLEVWKKSQANGQYTHIKSYDICRWSGDLGPKKTEGDRQAPEGFYNITPAQMNPNSSYHLAFNIGYPNAYDRAYGRTGSHLMVHGDCSSRGCYAMTDEQISEIYAIAREAFRGGQKSFQLQAIPFNMNAKNMFKFRNSPYYAFWQNLKEGVDQFEVTKQDVKVDVCNKKYIFNAQAGSSASAFDGTCPETVLAPEMKMALDAHKAKEREEINALMQAELHKSNGGKLAGMLGLGAPKQKSVDPVIAAKTVNKESAKQYLPSSAPEAVTLLALNNEELPSDLVNASATAQSAKAVASPSAQAMVRPARVVAPSDAEYLSALTSQTYITGSLGTFVKND